MPVMNLNFKHFTQAEILIRLGCSDLNSVVSPFQVQPEKTSPPSAE